MNTDTLVDTSIKACFEVHDELGIGFVEKVYENALTIALRDLGLEAKQQVPFQVYFRDHVVGEYFADVIIVDRLMIELKAVKVLLPEHQAQLINYLNATRLETGLLVNFAKKGLEIKRAFPTR